MTQICPSPGQKLFLMHVPKTGGISLSSLLRSYYRPDEICPASPGDGRWRHRLADVAHYKLFLGHLDLDFINALDPNGYKLTILRNPRDRIVSIYDFWRSISQDWSKHLTENDEDAPSYARRVSFSEFLESELDWVVNGISNSAARQLLGSNYEAYAHDETTAIHEAWSRLRGFDWFTTTEALSKDLPALATCLGASLPAETNIHLNCTYGYEPTLNRPAIAKTIPTALDFEKIDSLNVIDGALYRLAAKYRNRNDV